MLSIPLILCTDVCVTPLTWYTILNSLLTLLYSEQPAWVVDVSRTLHPSTTERSHQCGSGWWFHSSCQDQWLVLYIRGWAARGGNPYPLYKLKYPLFRQLLLGVHVCSWRRVDCLCKEKVKVKDGVFFCQHCRCIYIMYFVQKSLWWLISKFSIFLFL